MSGPFNNDHDLWYTYYGKVRRERTIFLDEHMIDLEPEVRSSKSLWQFHYHLYNLCMNEAGLEKNLIYHNNLSLKVCHWLDVHVDTLVTETLSRYGTFDI